MKKPAQWYERRFVESATKVHSECEVCKRSMWLPISKSAKYLTCGPECAEIRRANIKVVRKRVCVTCQNVFFPRSTQISSGTGRYCSVACAAPTREAGRTPEVIARRAAHRRHQFKAGILVAARGAASASWKGGRAAHLKRRAESGAQRESTRKYRRENPEKVREFNRRRSGRKVGRLQRGTVQRIGEAQRWRCAVCKTPIKGKYHADHVMPLALGGQHEAGNIQLLCPSCNVRKAAKHPIAFMQERGFLL